MPIPDNNPDKACVQISEKYSKKERYERLTRKYRVWYDEIKLPENDIASVYHMAKSVFEGAGIPNYGEAHPNFPKLTVVSVDGGHIKDQPNFFEFTVVYEYKPTDGFGGTDDSELDLTKHCDYDVEPFDEVVQEFYDENGNPKSYKNTAGAEFDPIGITRFALTFTETYNILVFPEADAARMVGNINSNAFTVCGAPRSAGALVCRSFSGKESVFTDKDGNETKYYAVTRKFMLYPDGGIWVHKVKSRGFEQLKDGKLQPIKIRKQLTKRAQPLNADGRWIEDDGVSDTEPVELEFHYKRVNFV